jgi:hypothetical protein
MSPARLDRLARGGVLSLTTVPEATYPLLRGSLDVLSITSKWHEQVYDVAGDANNGASVDLSPLVRRKVSAPTRCARYGPIRASTRLSGRSTTFGSSRIRPVAGTPGCAIDWFLKGDRWHVTIPSCPRPFRIALGPRRSGTTRRREPIKLTPRWINRARRVTLVRSPAPAALTI